MITSWATVTIAAFVAFIAFLQWMTAREKVVLDLFDKRFAIYKDLLRCVYSPIGDSSVVEFSVTTSRAKFLFGPKVIVYLEARKKDMSRRSVEAKNPPRITSEKQRQEVEKEQADRLSRLDNFLDDFDKLVIPYMQHSQKRLALADILPCG